MTERAVRHSGESSSATAVPERPEPACRPPSPTSEPQLRRTRKLWIAVYIAIVLAPFALMLAAPQPPGRTFTVELGSALGFAALAILVLQVVLPSRARPFTAPFGVDVLLRFHRQIGYASIVLVLAHLIVLLIDDPSRLSLLNPLIAPWRARAGVSALLCLLLLGLSSAWRSRFGLSYELWRGLHLILGGGLIGFSFAHMIGVDHYLSLGPIWVTSAALVALAGWGIVHLRVVRPKRAGGRPYVLTGVKSERGGAHTLQLRALGHRGTPFQPGQFAWLKLGEAPFSLQENPFSYSSSASRPHRPEFTVKQLGDFTAGVGRIPLGTKVLLDGPHGSFSPAHPDGDHLLIAAGVGITPMMSILRTLDDHNDRRRLRLVYASREWEGVTFREELGDIETRLDLEVCYVLSRPHDRWRGFRGRINRSILRHNIESLRPPFNVFICGPDAMVDQVLAELSGLGIPDSWVHAEKFVSA